MKEHPHENGDWKAIREGVIGLGKGSVRKTYYPDLQKRVQELERSEAMFRTMFDSASDGVFVHDAVSGELLDVNKRACDVWGLSREEILRLGLGFLSVRDTDLTPEMAMEAVRRATADGSDSLELRLRDSDGRVRWHEARLRRADLGGNDRVIVVARDVTESKIAQIALAEREAQLRTLINAMPDIVCFKDPQGKWLEANDYDLKLFELEGVDYRGKKDSELAEYSGFYREAFLACEETDERAWALGQPSRNDETIPRPQGEARVYDIIKIPMFNPDGTRKGLVVMGRDVTDQRMAEEHKRKFYRDTILSVTDGKLTICEETDIEGYVASAQMTGCVREPSEARSARRMVADYVARADENFGEFIVAVGEAIANALKHANGGNVYAARNEDEAWVAVRDSGPGIESIILPSAVLRRGFSTKPSLGMGFSIMLAAADRMLLCTGPTGTTVVLIKSLHPTESALGSDLWNDAFDLSSL